MFKKPFSAPLTCKARRSVQLEDLQLVEGRECLLGHAFVRQVVDAAQLKDAQGGGTGEGRAGQGGQGVLQEVG